MRISGFIKNTLVDFPGKIASTVFMAGCNFHCGFCHNPDMIAVNAPLLEYDEIFSYLKKASSRGFIDGVCITGGEPTMFPKSLEKIIEAIKGFDLLVKLDTNGSNPEILKSIDVDYVAMDLKTSFDRYNELSRISDIETRVKISAEFLVTNCSCDYEFRTTLVPDLVDEKVIASLGKSMQQNTKWFFQNFRNDVVFDPVYLTMIPYDEGYAQSLVSYANRFSTAIMR